MGGKRRELTGGGLQADAAYTTDDLMARLGFGRYGLAEMRRHGVRPVVVNGRHLYFGHEVLAYLKSLRDQQSMGGGAKTLGGFACDLPLGETVGSEAGGEAGTEVASATELN